VSDDKKQTVRLAFIGCGSHSGKTLQPNARMVEQIDLVAMCDLDESKAQAAAARWGARASYSDYGRMLHEQDLDAVVVVGPPEMMKPITKDVLLRGTPVLTEKPPAVTAAETLELVEASEQTGAVGMVATHWRHAPTYTRAKAIMEDERFGEPTHCHAWFFAPGPAGPRGSLSGLWNYLMFQGVHVVDCTLALMGDVAEVYAHAKGAHDDFESCSSTFRFANGATGTLSLAPRAPYWTGHRVFGKGGAFVAVENNRELCCAMPPFWTGEERPDYANHSFQTWDQGPVQMGTTGNGYLQELQHFAQCLLSGQQPVASLRDGYEAMRVLEAIRDSADTGKPVSLI